MIGKQRQVIYEPIRHKIKRGIRKRALCLIAAAGLLAAPQSLTGTGIFCSQALGAETEDLLIVDEGVEVEVNSGADLEELKAAERAQAQTEPETEVILDQRPVLEAASADMLEEFLAELTKEESPTGSDGELEMASYIREVMEGYGYTVSEQHFHEGFLNENGVDAPGINIIAERGANAETRHSDILIVSTHYDSKTCPQEGDALANDKSGAAVLLETARILAGVETDTDICFLFLSGEEDGLYGSLRFVEFLEEEYRSRIVGQIHVEQAGYDETAPYVLMTADGEANALGDLLREEGLTKDQELLESLEDGGDAETGIEENAGEEYSGDEPGAAENPPQNWDYTQDQQTSIRHFAESGIRAVTLIQELSGVSLEGDATPRIEELQKITDVLAMAVARVMSEQTGSLLY